MFALVSHSFRNICSQSWLVGGRGEGRERRQRGTLFQAVFEAWFGNFSNMLAIATFYASCASVCVCVWFKPSLGLAVSASLWSLVKLFAVIWLENSPKRKLHKTVRSPAAACPLPTPPKTLPTSAICPCDLYSITCQSGPAIAASPAATNLTETASLPPLYLSSPI